jgi:hypothetical protein
MLCLKKEWMDYHQPDEKASEAERHDLIHKVSIYSHSFHFLNKQSVKVRLGSSRQVLSNIAFSKHKNKKINRVCSFSLSRDKTKHLAGLQANTLP